MKETPNNNEDLTDILNSIKEVISNNDVDEPLELTDLVQDDAPSLAQGANQLAGNAQNTAVNNANSPIKSSVQSQQPNADSVLAQIVNNVSNAVAQKAGEEIAKPQSSAEITLQSILEQPTKTQNQPTEQLVNKAIADESRELLAKVIKKPQKRHDSPEFRSGIIVEDLVVELLKPILQAWLNEHLLDIVKTVVEKEVRKIIPKED